MSRREGIGAYEGDRRYCTGSSDGCWDHAVVGLSRAVSSKQCMGAVPCGLGNVGIYDRSMGDLVLSKEGLMEPMDRCL